MMSTDAAEIATAALEKSINIFLGRVRAGSPSSFLTGKQAGVELGSLADGRARLAAGNALICCFSRSLLPLLAEQRSRCYLATFCFDGGLVSADACDLKALKHKVYKALSSHRLHAVCMVEIAPFRKSNLHEEFFHAHIHALCCTSDVTFQPNVTAKALMRGRAFPNFLGLPSVTIRSRKKAASLFKGSLENYLILFGDPELDQTEHSLAWQGYYLLKAPSYIKHAYVNKKGRTKTRSSHANYSPRQARDLFDLLNSVPVEDGMFGVGQGRTVRLEWKRLYKQQLVGATKMSVKTRKRARRKRLKKARAKLAF